MHIRDDQHVQSLAKAIIGPNDPRNLLLGILRIIPQS